MSPPDHSSYSCGYRKVYDDYVNILQQKYPEISIFGANYDPPGLSLQFARFLVSVAYSSWFIRNNFILEFLYQVYTCTTVFLFHLCGSLCLFSRALLKC